MTYRGWLITYSAARPVTGKWRAERAGVGMGAGSEDALYRMINTRVNMEETERAAGIPAPEYAKLDPLDPRD